MVGRRIYIVIEKTLLLMDYISIYSILFSELRYFQNIFSPEKNKSSDISYAGLTQLNANISYQHKHIFKGNFN